MEKKRDYLRIFLGSPSDVEAEREIAYRVISETEEIFQILKDYNLAISVPPLIALGWEKVPPDAGFPNNVILERFPIEESDIFVFFLWKRFGTPPGTQDRNNRGYSSGTEEEFIRAFEQRKKSENGHPAIMLYRKTDAYSIIGKDSKEIKQYDKVARFFRECEPSGKYPTYIYDFKTSDFEANLRKHLIDNILKLHKIAPQESEKDREEHIPEDKSAKDWLEKNNLSANPFHHRFAENEIELEKYYVRFKDLQLNIDYLIKDKNGWLVFGREGSGKTALRKFLMNKCADDPQIHCIEFSDEENFGSAVTEKQDIDKIALSITIQICKKTLKVMNSNSILDFQNITTPSSVLLLMQEKLKEQKIGQILIFIDPFKQSVKNVATTTSVLARLANISVDGIGLRFFLPKKIYMMLSNKQHSYIGRCTPLEIKWEPNELLELIRSRMRYFSKDKRNVVSSLGILGEPKGGMDRIDQAIIGLSENTPRAVIWLADQLISKHCQNQPIPVKIQRQTWDQVQEEWWSWGRNHILGLLGQEDEFWQSGNDIYFKGVILDLSKRSKMLISILIEAEGRICTKEKFIKVGWKNESGEGISDAAVREAIRRLKVELKTKNNINPEWIKTVHNQGYQLQNPDSDTLD